MRPILFKTYTRLLMALYDAGGTLRADNRRWLALVLETRMQDVARLLNELATLGKIEIRDGVIHNRRTDYEFGCQIMEPNAYPKPQVEPSLPLWSSEKPNENFARARDRDSRIQKYNLLLQSTTSPKSSFNGSAAIGPSPGFGGRYGPTPLDEGPIAKERGRPSRLTQHLVSKGLRKH